MACNKRCHPRKPPEAFPNAQPYIIPVGAKHTGKDSGRPGRECAGQSLSLRDTQLNPCRLAFPSHWRANRRTAPRTQTAARIPIPEIGFAEQCPFIHLYAEIQAAKRAAVDTRELQWRLDELVYALYGLTEAESTAIERSLGLIHATDAAEDAALFKWMQDALAEPGERRR